MSNQWSTKQEKLDTRPTWAFEQVYDSKAGYDIFEEVGNDQQSANLYAFVILDRAVGNFGMCIQPLQRLNTIKPIGEWLLIIC